MPQFGGMHVSHPLGGHYSSWVSRRYNRAPLVLVCGVRVLVVCGEENQCVKNVLEKCSVSTVSREVVQCLRAGGS
jgi:hypothetical protein